MSFRPLRRREGASKFFKKENTQGDREGFSAREHETSENFNTENNEDVYPSQSNMERAPRPFYGDKNREPRSFSPKPRNTYSDSQDRKPYQNYENRFSGSSERKPYENSESRYSDRSDRKPYQGSDSYGQNRAREPRPFYKQNEYGNNSENRSYGQRDNSYSDRPFRPSGFRQEASSFDRDKSSFGQPKSFGRDSFDRENRENRDNRENRESRFSRDNRDNRDFRENRNFRDSRDSHDSRENRFSRDNRDSRENGSRPYNQGQRSFEKPSYGQRPYGEKPFREFPKEGYGPKEFSRERDNKFQGNRDSSFRDKPFREGRTSRFRENLDSLFDVDVELLRILTRRAELLESVKRDGRIDPALEKKLRNAWEAGVVRVTKDPRIARDFFNLLQQIEPILLVDGQPTFYNLSPQRMPVQIDIAGPVCSRQIRMFFAIAAASGVMTAFQTVLSPAIMSSIKAFNQLGGQLWWEGDGRVLSRGGNGVTPHVDKVIPVGEDPLSFYLVLSLALLVPSRLKLVGDGALRFLDTSALRQFLPSINARMTTVIPGQEGIPVRIESAGLLPQIIDLPSNLPADFIISFVVMAFAREEELTVAEFRIENHPEANRIAAEVTTILDELDIPNSVEFEGEMLNITVTPSDPAFSDDIQVELDNILTTALLSIPAFVGGSVKLQGALGEAAGHCLEYLKSLNLRVEVEENALLSEKNEAQLTMPDFALSPTYAFNILFMALLALREEEVVFDKATLPAHVSENVVFGFFAQLGLAPEEGTGILRPCEAETTPWFAPDAYWGIALSLGAYLKPNVHLANPDIVSEKYPLYWRIYNGLPCPDLTVPLSPALESLLPIEPSPRRIFADAYTTIADRDLESDDNE